MYETRPDPQNFSELVDFLKSMDWNEWIENDDTGKMRRVQLDPSVDSDYDMFEDDRYIGSTKDVVAAAQFIAEGWEAYEVQSSSSFYMGNS